MQIEGKRGPGGPKMTWRTLSERDRSEWNLNEVDPCARDLSRDLWRSSVISAMRAASQVHGRESTDVDLSSA